jgi:hypothetical protein
VVSDSFHPEADLRPVIEHADELADCLTRAYELELQDDCQVVATLVEVWSRELVE